MFSRRCRRFSAMRSTFRARITSAYETQMPLSTKPMNVHSDHTMMNSSPKQNVYISMMPGEGIAYPWRQHPNLVKSLLRFLIRHSIDNGIRHSGEILRRNPSCGCCRSVALGADGATRIGGCETQAAGCWGDWEGIGPKGSRVKLVVKLWSEALISPWWGRGDSNSHAFQHMILSHARLPVPTLPRAGSP